MKRLKRVFILFVAVIAVMTAFSGCKKVHEVEVIYEGDIAWEWVEVRWLDYHHYSGDYVAEPIRDIDENNIVTKEEIAKTFIKTAESYNKEKMVVHIAYIKEKAYCFVATYEDDGAAGGGNECVVDAMTGEVIVCWGAE